MTDRSDDVAREAQKKRAARIHDQIERLKNDNDKPSILPAPAPSGEAGTSTPPRPDYREIIDYEMRRDRAADDADCGDGST